MSNTTIEKPEAASVPPQFTLQAAMRSGKAHVMLWSQSQCALHIEPVEAMLSSNRKAYSDDRRMDYVPLFIGTDEDCRSLADSIRNTMHTRQDARRVGSAAQATEAAHA